MPDLINRRFGRLRVLRRGRSTPKHLYYVCRCSCGTEKQVRSDSLTSGAVRSCGCLWRSVISQLGIHHQPGERFGRLRIIRQVGVLKKRGRVYLCRCDCGKTIKVQGRHLRSRETQSCGCLYRDSRRRANFRHGQSPAKNASPVYDAFHRQRSWCRNPNDHQAQYYSQRGVEFRFSSFSEFYREVGDKPGPDCWLVRINRDGHFEPGNLHWISVKRHRRKRKRRLK
jgi:hypothetical protein